MSEHLPDVDIVTELRAAAVAYRSQEIKLRGYDGASAGMATRAADELERLRNALAGVSTCSTCEVCRGAALLALGTPVTTQSVVARQQVERCKHGTVIVDGYVCLKCFREPETTPDGWDANGSPTK